VCLLGLFIRGRRREEKGGLQVGQRKRGRKKKSLMSSKRALGKNMWGEGKKKSCGTEANRTDEREAINGSEMVYG